MPPPLSQQPPSKNRDPVKHPLPFFENLVRSSNHSPHPPTERGGDEHYRYVCLWNYMYYLNVFLYNLCGFIVLQKNNEIKKKILKINLKTLHSRLALK